MKNIVRSLDKKEIEDILKHEEKIEIHCDFCNTYYSFNKNQIKEILND